MAQDAGDHAADAQDLDAMINDLIAIRRRVGGCPCGPPCDGTKVDDDLSDEALDAMYARLVTQAASLDEDLTAAPCDCAERPAEMPEIPEVPVPRSPRTLMRLPEELRNMIWWAALAPGDRIVRIVPWTLGPGQNVGTLSPSYHRERVTVPGRNVPLPGLTAPLPQRETWRRLGERPENNLYAVLRVNKQVYEEAEREFWFRASIERLMFSFGPALPDRIGEHYGILSAWTFFQTILRDNPQYLPNNRGADYLGLIRRVHLDLTDNLGFGNRQALAHVPRFGHLNATQYLDNLLDDMHTHLTGLEHLALTFGGWVPDMRQIPVSGPMWLFVSAGIDSHAQWLEGPPSVGGAAPPPPPGQSSAHWVTRLLNFSQRPVTRLRLRVTFHLDNMDNIQNLAQDPRVLRVVHFVTTLRRSMLVNGNALGNGFVLVRRNYNGRLPRAVVQCDDSWDENTGTHAHHNDIYIYDPTLG